MNNTSRIIVLVLGVAFTLFSIFIIQMSYNDINKAQETEAWPSTNGLVLSSYIHTTHDGDSTTYGAKIEYNYSVNGIEYASNRISYGYAHSSDYSAASNLVDTYYVGKTINVYYDPQNPRESVLITGIDSASWFFLAFGIIFLILGFICIIIALYSHTKSIKSSQIRIKMDKYYFKPGETISGSVILSFKKQKPAKSLKVALVGEKFFHQYRRDNSKDYAYPIHRSEQILDLEKDYLNETYPFSINIPSDVLEKSKNFGEDGVGYFLNKPIQFGEKVANLQKKAKKFAQSTSTERDVWYIEAILEVSRGIDLKTTQDVLISEN